MTKQAANTLVVTVILGLVLLGTGVAIREKRKLQIAGQTGQLPSVAFHTLQGKALNLRMIRPGHPALIMYYSPDCEYCQQKAEELGKYGHAGGTAGTLNGVSLIMISPSGSRACMDFAIRYKLDSLPRLFLLLDSNQLFYHTFGTDHTPSYLVYDGAGRLIKKVDGDASMDFLTRNLPLLNVSTLTGYRQIERP